MASMQVHREYMIKCSMKITLFSYSVAPASLPVSPQESLVIRCTRPFSRNRLSW